jgi:hypothetical protein
MIEVYAMVHLGPQIEKKSNNLMWIVIREPTEVNSKKIVQQRRNESGGVERD